jgi:hypothetical protein
MNLLEAEPQTRLAVYHRLKQRVPWRPNYLRTATFLSNPVIIEGRVQTFNRLQASGDRILRWELAPSVAAMVASGLTADAFTLWRRHSNVPATPLHDGNFRIAVAAGTDTDSVFPFEWEFLSGSGFSAYPSQDGLNGANVAVQWDGRGVPVFMRQLTSATPGHYRVSFRVDGDAQKFASKIGVRFRCKDSTTRLRNSVSPNSQIVTAETITPVACDFPWIDIFGEIQDRSGAVELSFNSINAARISD